MKSHHSWFGSIPAAVAVKKSGADFIGNVKTAKKQFPIAFLNEQLKDAPRGLHLALSAIVDGVELIAVGYKYSSKRVLTFISTLGSDDLRPGTPYVARFPVKHGNVATRDVPRPHLVSEYFKRSPAVDVHNQLRQHERRRSAICARQTPANVL